METNKLPKINMDKSETGCCPKFDPAPWKDQELKFKDKPFAMATTCNFFHIPLNMGSMMKKLCKTLEENNMEFDEFFMMSCDPSPWKGEHYFSVSKKLPGYKMVKMSGTYLTKVFEGPYKDAGKWVKEMDKFVNGKGKDIKKLYFYYTTCPKCAKHYGKNYTVALAEV